MCKCVFQDEWMHIYPISKKEKKKKDQKKDILKKVE